ncbi:MAG: hypothetical protein JST92_00155 [Deltaproteobacteria bacterium]|nr:hypothetical protein [Deltaproteobacteria bacterium]
MLAATSGCHARWNPFSTAPQYGYKPQEGTLGLLMRGNLTDSSAGYFSDFHYAVPAKGTLRVRLQGSDPTVPLEVHVFSDGSVPVAAIQDPVDKSLIVPVDAGDFYVVVSQSWKGAKNLYFSLFVEFAHAPGAFGCGVGGQLMDDVIGSGANERYEVPASGTLYIRVDGVDPEARLVIQVFTDSKTPIAATRAPSDRALLLPVQKGPHLVVVGQTYERPTNATVTLCTAFAPDTSAMADTPR